MTKIAVIHSSYLNLAGDADPGHVGFGEESALKYVYSNINKTLDQIKKAGHEKADIVCTHEDFTNAGAYGWEIIKHPGLFAKIVEKTTGEIRSLLSTAAKQYSMMIAANHYESENGKLYNTSTLYGRDGEIIGQYKKVHLPSAERWNVEAGDEYPVFKTDIGNIGFVTCYDIYFPEISRALALNGADIIIHQTQGWGWSSKGPENNGPILGESLMRARAFENSIYLIVSKVIQNGGKDGGRSIVVDNFGGIIADSGTSEEKILYTEIDPDFNMEDEYAYGTLLSGINGLRPMFLLSRRPETYSILTNDAPEILKRYPGMRFKDHTGEPEEIMKIMNAMSDEERSKFHW